jgi:hypothetical protein
VEIKHNLSEQMNPSFICMDHSHESSVSGEHYHPWQLPISPRSRFQKRDCVPEYLNPPSCVFGFLPGAGRKVNGLFLGILVCV